MTADTYILSRIQAIELADLKKQLHTKPRRDVKSLYGILKGLEASEQDLDEAQRSWLKDAKDADA